MKAMCFVRTTFVGSYSHLNNFKVSVKPNAASTFNADSFSMKENKSDSNRTGQTVGTVQPTVTQQVLENTFSYIYNIRGYSRATVLEHMLIKCIFGVIVRDHPFFAVSAG